MVVNIAKISQMKNKSLLSREKKYRMKEALYDNYKKVLF